MVGGVYTYIHCAVTGETGCVYCCHVKSSDLGNVSFATSEPISRWQSSTLNRPSLPCRTRAVSERADSTVSSMLSPTNIRS